MAELRKTASQYDLIRIGAYSQMEGNFRFHKRSGYRFTFFLQQIEDMEELINRIVYLDNRKHNTYIQFYSKSLLDALTSLGFYKFNTHDWNIPRVVNQSDAYRDEYMRAVIDSLGNVDVDTYRGDNVPYVRIQSVNHTTLPKLAHYYGGKYFQWRDRSTLQWKGDAALSLLAQLDWKLYGMRNQRGAELIKNIRWEKFVW